MNQNIAQESDIPEWEPLEKEIKKAEEIYRWQIRVDSARSGKFGRYIQNGMAIAIILIGLFIGWLTIQQDNWTFFWISSGLGLFMSGFIRFLWMADSEYDFVLTEKGIYYTQQQVIPEIAYKIVRGSSWVGIGVCVCAAALVGPLAFVGAGAFALMSFSMTNFSSVTTSFGIYFSGNYSILHLKNQEVIQLYNDNRELYGVGIIFCSPDEKFHLFEKFKSLFPDTEIIEINKHGEFFKYRKTPSEETSSL